MKYGIWVSPVSPTRKWPLEGWLLVSLHLRQEVLFDTVADAMAYLRAAVTYWDTKYEIKEYAP